MPSLPTSGSSLLQKLLALLIASAILLLIGQNHHLDSRHTFQQPLIALSDFQYSSKSLQESFVSYNITEKKVPVPDEPPVVTVTLPMHICHLLNDTVKIPILPQFIIVGAQKCGTTALYEFLKEHPNIRGSTTTETHFFDWHYPSKVQLNEWLDGRHFPRNLPQDDFQCALRKQYTDLFNTTDAAASTIFFEKTPSYLFLPEVPERIASTLVFPEQPSYEPKIIVILRNPIDRALSHYRMLVKNDQNFDGIVDAEIERFREVGLSHAPLRTDQVVLDDPGFRLLPSMTREESDQRHWRHYRKMHLFNLLQRGMYATQLQHWTQHFVLGETLLVVPYERFKTDPQSLFFQILDFVGAPHFVPAEGFGTVHNARGPTKDSVSNNTRRYLSTFFGPYNDQLADMLGDEWRDIWAET